MKTALLIMAALFVTTINATIISFTSLTQSSTLMTGYISKVKYQNNTVSGTDAVLNNYIEITANSGAGVDYIKIYDYDWTSAVTTGLVYHATFDAGISNLMGPYNNPYYLSIKTINAAYSQAMLEFANNYGFPHNKSVFVLNDDGSGFSIDGSVATVPEPMTMGLFGLGLIGLAFLRRKK